MLDIVEEFFEEIFLVLCDDVVLSYVGDVWLEFRGVGSWYELMGFLKLYVEGYLKDLRKYFVWFDVMRFWIVDDYCKWWFVLFNGYYSG